MSSPKTPSELPEDFLKLSPKRPEKLHEIETDGLKGDYELRVRDLSQ